MIFTRSLSMSDILCFHTRAAWVTGRIPQQPSFLGHSSNLLACTKLPDDGSNSAARTKRITTTSYNAHAGVNYVTEKEPQLILQSMTR